MKTLKPSWVRPMEGLSILAMVRPGGDEPWHRWYLYFWGRTEGDFARQPKGVL